MRIETINQLDRAGFVHRLGAVYENSPWVAGQAWEERPFASRAELHAKMSSAVKLAGPEAQLALIRAHPELARRAKMSEDSVMEQKGAGLDRLTPEELERLENLNQRYRSKFGFPFILAVRGKDKNDILRGLEARLLNTPETEFAEALRQIDQIALFRLEDLIEDPEDLIEDP